MESVGVIAYIVGTHRWRNTMIKIVIAILVVAAVINVLVIFSCCIVAGRADEVAENWMRDHEQ